MNMIEFLTSIALLLHYLSLIHGLVLSISASQIIRHFSREKLIYFMEAAAPDPVGLRPILTLLHSLRGYFDFGRHWFHVPISNHLDSSVQLAKFLKDPALLNLLLPIRALQRTEQGRQWLIAHHEEYPAIRIAVDEWKPSLWHTTDLRRLLNAVLAAPANHLVDGIFCEVIVDTDVFLLDSLWMLVDPECLLGRRASGLSITPILEHLIRLASAPPSEVTPMSASISLLAKVRLASYHRRRCVRRSDPAILKTLTHSDFAIKESLILYSVAGSLCKTDQLISYINKLGETIRQLPDIPLVIKNAFIFELLTTGLAGARDDDQQTLQVNNIIQLLRHVHPRDVAPLHSRRLFASFLINISDLPPAWAALIDSTAPAEMSTTQLEEYEIDESIFKVEDEEADSASSHGEAFLSDLSSYAGPGPHRYFPTFYLSKGQKINEWRRTHLWLSSPGSLDLPFEASIDEIPIPEIFTDATLPTGMYLTDAVIRAHWEVRNSRDTVVWSRQSGTLLFNCASFTSVEARLSRLSRLRTYWLGRIYLLALNGIPLPPISLEMKHLLTSRTWPTTRLLNHALESNCMQHRSPGHDGFHSVLEVLRQIFEEFSLFNLL